MTSTPSKTFAWIAIPLLSAAGLTIINTISQGELFEGKKAQAALQAATAELEKAKAELQKAVAALATAQAAKLDAENKLLAAVEARGGQRDAAYIISAGTRDAATITGRAVVEAAKVEKYVDNTVFQEFVSPILGPTKQIAENNLEIERLQREIETGRERHSHRILTEAERADRAAQKLMLQDDVVALGRAPAQTIGAVMQSVVAGFGAGTKEFAISYPDQNTPPTRRFIVQEP